MNVEEFEESIDPAKQQAVASPIDCLVSRNTTTADTPVLTDAQVRKIAQLLEDSIVEETRLALGGDNTVKFEGTFIWPTPKPDDFPLGIIKLNVCA